MINPDLLALGIDIHFVNLEKESLEKTMYIENNRDTLYPFLLPSIEEGVYACVDNVLKFFDISKKNGFKYWNFDTHKRAIQCGLDGISPSYTEDGITFFGRRIQFVSSGPNGYDWYPRMINDAKDHGRGIGNIFRYMYNLCCFCVGKGGEFKEALDDALRESHLMVKIETKNADFANISYTRNRVHRFSKGNVKVDITFLNKPAEIPLIFIIVQALEI